MALRPAPDLDPRLSARHPLRKQRSAAGREPRPRADPPTATYPHTTASEAPAVLGALLLWTACGAIRASPHAGMLSWSAARAPQRAHRQAHLVFRSWFPVRSDDFPCNTHTIIATTFVNVSTIQGNCWFPDPPPVPGFRDPHMTGRKFAGLSDKAGLSDAPARSRCFRSAESVCGGAACSKRYGFRPRFGLGQRFDWKPPKMRSAFHKLA